MFPMINLSGTRRDVTELPEVLVISKNHTLLHMLAYVREYSTLKQATGITRYRARKNLNNQWDEFRKGRREGVK